MPVGWSITQIWVKPSGIPQIWVNPQIWAITQIWGNHAQIAQNWVLHLFLGVVIYLINTCTSVEFDSKHKDFHSRNCFWKCLWNGDHFVQTSVCLPLRRTLWNRPIAWWEKWPIIAKTTEYFRYCYDLMEIVLIETGWFSLVFFIFSTITVLHSLEIKKKSSGIIRIKSGFFNYAIKMSCSFDRDCECVTVEMNVCDIVSDSRASA